MNRRAFSTAARMLSHENPLGLPRTGTPPHLRTRGPAGKKRAIASVGKTIAVSSAKGGVGKSTVAANLAIALARRGLRTGVLDADIFGPSVPTLFGLEGEEPRLNEASQLLPLTNYGVKTMSMGYLVPDSQPVAWRGLLVGRALDQLLHQVDWGGLDLLLLDLPPGTGDVQLSVIQQVELAGALLVSTASRLALADTLRGRALFDKTEVPVLGAVHNMAAHACASCGHLSSVFGERGRQAFQDHGLDVLAELPLDSAICDAGDAGRPAVVADPDGAGARVFVELAAKVATRVGL